MSSVAIVDSGLCNVDSIARAVEECGADPFVTNRPEDLETVTHIILPGVGAFADAMRILRERQLDLALQEQAGQQKIPLLGICLGMQLLARRGTEGGETAGLGFLDAEVVRLAGGTDEDGVEVRVPHVGWNEIYPTGQRALLDGIQSGTDFYFVHSYHMQCRDENDVLATTRYGQDFVSIVGRDNVVGAQFHPEKSMKAGLKLIKNFLTQ